MDNKPQEFFSEIFNQYIDKIYRFIFLKINSEDTAKDLTSEVFVRTWDTIKNGQEIENPKAFLYQVARNALVDFYRQKSKIPISLANCAEVADPVDIEEKAVIDSDIETVKNQLVNLKDDHRELIVLYYVEGYSVPEIAKTLNKPEGTVRVALHRALKALKEALNIKPDKARKV